MRMYAACDGGTHIPPLLAADKRFYSNCWRHFPGSWKVILNLLIQ